jgi:hypothetical protein
LAGEKVGGRIQKFASFWRDHVGSSWVLELVQSGHKLEFTSKPLLSVRIKWTIIVDPARAQVLAQEVDELLQKEAIEVADPKTPGFYCHFFLVKKKDGGFRPVLNLKPLNKFILYKKFTMETSRTVLHFLRQGQWMVSLDLKDAYLHVPIYPSHRPFLRFAFQGKVYQFRVLPFGLSSAPRVFTHVLEPLVKVLHTRGIQFIPYLDDCLVLANSVEVLQNHLNQSLQVLQSAGFLINQRKSHLVPTQDLVFLGMRIRTDLGLVFLPEDKISMLKRQVSLILNSTQVTAKECLRLLGLMAACLHLVPQARLLMRPFQLFFLSRWKYERHPLDFILNVPPSLHQYLLPWRDEQLLSQGVQFQLKPPSKTITTDASNLGWGGVLGENTTQGLWEESERNLHINCLELLAVYKTLRTFTSRLSGHKVLVMTDNTTVRQYINKMGGTKSAILCALTMKMLQWCQTHHISLVSQHVPGVSNVLADRLSRVFLPQTEWRLNPMVVNLLFNRWGYPSIDLFATNSNKQCPVFVSWHQEVAAYHIDAMTMNWSGHFLYAFPPIPLLNLVVQKLLEDRPEMILITPFWPSRAWFPPLLDMIVDDPIQLPILPDLLTQDKGRQWHPNPGVWSPVAWRVSNVTSKVKGYRERLQKLYWHQDPPRPTKSTNLAGVVTLDGAGTRALIPLRLLSLKY